jgi:hypothetical protein
MIKKKLLYILLIAAIVLSTMACRLSGGLTAGLLAERGRVRTNVQFNIMYMDRMSIPTPAPNNTEQRTRADEWQQVR